MLVAPSYRHGHWIGSPLLRRSLVGDRVLILVALVVRRLLRRMRGRRVGSIVSRPTIGKRYRWLHM